MTLMSFEVLIYIKVNGYTFRGGNSVKINFACLQKSKIVYSKRKEFASLGSKFFPFRVDHFLDWH